MLQPLDYSSIRRPKASRGIRVCIGIAIGIVVTVPTILAGIVSAGGGHGHYEAARAFFPLPLLMTQLTGNQIDGFVLFLVFVQFPIYGAIIGWYRGIRLIVAAIAITVLHCGAAVACFSGAVPNFS
jgi:hypothetical protein